MTVLTIADAIQAVRKNLDEVGLNNSSMFGTDNDNEELDSIISDSIPEAINIVNRSAPQEMLEGCFIMFCENPRASVTSLFSGELAFSVMDGVASFAFSAYAYSPIGDLNVLRILSCKANDSDITVSAIEEMSPIGRQQANPYVRGTHDKPVLVHRQYNNSAEHDCYKYYTFKEDTSDPRLTVIFIPVCEKEGVLYVSADEGQEAGYYVSPLVKESILNQLTSMVLTIYGETDKATIFSSRI